MSLLKKKLLGEATNNISLDELPDIILFSPTSDVFVSASIIPKPIVSLVPYYEFTPSPTNNLDDSGSPMLRISQNPYSSSTNMEFSSPASPSLRVSSPLADNPTAVERPVLDIISEVSESMLVEILEPVSKFLKKS